MRGFLIALGCLATLGCSSGSTIVVRVESDLAVPGELDEVVVEVEGRRASASLGPGALPATLELHASGDRLGPYELRVTGRLAGADVASVTRPVTFQSGSTLAVTVRLDAACADVMCPAGQRCEGGACVGDPIDGGVDAGLDAGVDAGELVDGGADAGPGDAGECVVERCNGADDDCDGSIDEAGCEPCLHTTFEGHVYQLCNTKLSFDVARARCQAGGYDLVTLDGDAEANHLRSEGAGAITAEPFIGYRGADDMSFAWVDGSASGYENWQGSEPGTGGCAVVRGNGRWRVEDCASEQPFLCELVP